MIVMPTLTYGSSGQPVILLQTVLNAWAQFKSVTPQLVPDGAFGPRTLERVKQFQLSAALIVDGIVGPMTWQALEPFIQAVKANVPIPNDEAAAGERIVSTAWQWYMSFGWLPNTKPDPYNPRIAAAFCADDTNPIRPRQGGAALGQIMAIAEVGRGAPTRALTISQEAVRRWQSAKAEDQEWRNQNDMPAWCGIFAVAMLRMAGFSVPNGWAGHPSHVIAARDAFRDGRGAGPVYRFILDPKDAFRGCIGNRNPGTGDHHFIVTDNQDGLIRSIDGNSDGSRMDADPKLKWQVKSTIYLHEYSHAALKAKGAYFIFPAPGNR